MVSLILIDLSLAIEALFQMISRYAEYFFTPLIAADYQIAGFQPLIRQPAVID